MRLRARFRPTARFGAKHQLGKVQEATTTFVAGIDRPGGSELHAICSSKPDMPTKGRCFENGGMLASSNNGEIVQSQ
jgi:hypothetical protein